MSNHLHIYDPHGPEPIRPDPRYMDHLFQLAITHEETLRQWEEEQEQEAGTAPELARKLAAMRTELLRRQFEQLRGE